MKRTLVLATIWVLSGCGGCGDDTAGTNNGDNANNGDPCATPTEISRADVESGGTLKAGTCYDADESLEVTDGTLTIEPGVTIRMAQDRSLRISGSGRVSAKGTADAPITFQGQDDTKGFWQGLAFETRSDDNLLEYVILLNGGGKAWSGSSDEQAVIHVASTGKVTIRETLIDGSGKHGIFGRDNAELSGFSSNTISNCDGAPLRIALSVARFLDSGSTFEGNEDNVVALVHGNNETLAQDATWPNPGLPYRFMDRCFIKADLTLTPGTTLEVEADASLILEEGGQIIAEGTTSELITFTSVDDAGTGSWQGIHVKTGTSVFSNAVIEHAGSKAWTGNPEHKGAFFISAGELSLSDVEIRDSEGYGVVVHDAGSITCDGVTFTATAAGTLLDTSTAGNAVCE